MAKMTVRAGGGDRQAWRGRIAAALVVSAALLASGCTGLDAGGAARQYASRRTK